MYSVTKRIDFCYGHRLLDYQVEIRRTVNNNPFGYEIELCWIPSEFAKTGKILKIYNRKKGNWYDGWKVMETYTKLPAANVEKYERDYLTQREVSDV